MIKSTHDKSQLVVFFYIIAFLGHILTPVSYTYCSDPELIYLTDGASKGVMQMLNTIIRNERDGVCYYSLKAIFALINSVLFLLKTNFTPSDSTEMCTFLRRFWFLFHNTRFILLPFPSLVVLSCHTT